MLRNEPGARMFLATYTSLARDRGIVPYGDQQCLFATYTYHRDANDIAFYAIDSSLEMSRFLDDRALAWSPTPSRKRSSRFREHSQNWLQQFHPRLR